MTYARLDSIAACHRSTDRELSRDPGIDSLPAILAVPFVFRDFLPVDWHPFRLVGIRSRWIGLSAHLAS